ncbi:hypothetical protein RF11_07398 [Thelohanellus kitauei]|uniref:Uncharacterized protein n=1 Tax=Thelohanellus kitauei TaxID=669202 RepID=A0A0C2N9R9_THEKT|nr:hypothetical protein RF11_07398 [Thelohanellus kitauei]
MRAIQELLGNPNPDFAKAASAPGQQLVAIQQQLTYVLRVVKTNAGTQAPPKNQEGCPTALKKYPEDKRAFNIRSGACGLVWLARVSGLLTLAALRRVVLKSMLPGDWPTPG